MAVQPDGKLVIGGGFTSVNGSALSSTTGVNCIARLHADGTLDSSFNSSGGVGLGGTDNYVNSVAVQPDGKLVIGGAFTRVNRSTANSATGVNRIARLNTVGTLDTAFNSSGGVGLGGANNTVSSMIVQADGKLLISGSFTSVNGSALSTTTGVNRIARLAADGMLDTAFNSNGGVGLGGANNSVFSVAAQADGKSVLCGSFTLMNGATRGYVARLNNDSAMQNLIAPDATRVQWQRGGASPEIARATFEHSTDGGNTWTAIGSGTRVGTTSNWQLTGLSLSHGDLLRARGHMSSGWQNGGASLIAQSVTVDFVTQTPTLTSPAMDSATEAPVTVTFTLPEAAMLGSVKLDFGSATLTLADSQESAGQHTFTFDPADPVPSSGGAIAAASGLIADGTYTVTLRYRDAAGNPEASAASTNVTIDTITQTPTLSSVTSAFYQGRQMGASFTLTEDALAGSVKLTFTGVGAPRVLTLSNFFGPTNSYGTSFDPDSPTALGNIVSGAPLTDGTYSVTLSYQDALGNAATSSAPVNGVVVGSGPVPGTLDVLDPGLVGSNLIATAVQPDGKIVLGGAFTSCLGAARNNVARLKADGTLDTNFDPNANNFVYGVTVQPDGKVLLAGAFTTMQPPGTSSPVTRNYLARVNAAGTLDAVFDPNPDNVVVGGTVLPDGKLLVWGYFTALQPNGGSTVARNYIARLNANGTLDESFNPNPDAAVFCAAVQADGKIVLSGSFTSLTPNGVGAPVARKYVARIDANGMVDPDFDPNPDIRVFSTAVQADGKLLLSGEFTALQPGGAPAPTTRNRIARVNADGTLDMGFDPNANGDVHSVVVQADGRVLLCGAFTTLQPNSAPTPTTRNRIARVNASGTLDTDFDPNANNSAFSLAVQADGKVLFGGAFTTLQPDGAASPTAGSLFARLANDPATQTLTTPDATHVSWQRGGAGPELTGVTFERSTDSGATWTSLGTGARVGTTANWQLTGFDLNGVVGMVRARGRTASGYLSSSAGLIEQTGDFNFTPGFTATPTLTTPATNARTKSPVTVTFTLPEAAASGTVKVTFVRSSDGSLTRTLTLAASQEGAGEHTIMFDPANPTASSAVASIAPVGSNIPDLTYDVTVSYQDAAGNPAASSAGNTNVAIDTITQEPALLSFPQTDGTLGGPVTSSNPYSTLLINLPEAALPGSVTFTFDDGTTQYVFPTTTAIGASGSNQIVFSPADPVGVSFRGFPLPAGAAAIASGPSTLPQGGPYSVSFTYQDAVGNSAVQSNIATGVIVDLVTQTPTLSQPTTGAFIRNSVMVNFTLPEAGFDSPGVLTLSFGATTLLLDQSLRTAGNHSFTFDPADPVGTSNGAIVSGSALADGAYAVTLSYRDAVFNPAATATATNVRIDRVPPTFSPNFSPTIVYAGTALANYEFQTGASDPNGLFVGGLGSQSPSPGTVLTAGTQRVTFTVADNAGNVASTFFDLIVRPANAVNTVLSKAGDPVYGAGTAGGPPDGATFTTFGPPAADNFSSEIAFLAKWTSDGGKGSGLFADEQFVAKVGGDASALTGTTGSTFKSFTDPVSDQEHVVCLVTFTGVPRTSAAGVLSLPDARGMELTARAGDPATTDGAKFKSFKSLAVLNEYVGFLAQLVPGTGSAPRTTPANDLGLWVKDGADPLVLALREGQTIFTASGDKIIKTLVSSAAGNGSPGQGRGWLHEKPAEGAYVLALAIFTDRSQAIIRVDTADVANPAILSRSGVANADGSPDLTDATFASYGLPTAITQGSSAFLASLTPSVTLGITKANARGIFANDADRYAPLVRVGDPSGVAGANFSLLKDPVLAEDGGLAFPATIKGGTVRGAAMTTLWWQPSGGAPGLLAQGGAEPADLPGAQWKSFPSLAIAANRGPIFTATLVPGKGGVTAKSASGVWACDFLGQPRLLFRTGMPDAIVPGKTLKRFTLLNAAKGSTGVTRSFSDTQRVLWLATFTDKSQAIITTEVP